MRADRLAVFVLLALLLPLTLAAQESPKPQPLRAKVEFVLRREDGTPLRRKVKAHLYNAAGEVDGAGSDDAGVVRFERLPSASYDLWVEPSDDEQLAAALFRHLRVTAGNDGQQIPLTVPRSGGVKGRLLLADGKTPAAHYVVAVQSGTMPDEKTAAEARRSAYARGALSCYAESVVAADGAFLLRGLTPGEHLLDIRKPGEREAWSSLAGAKVTAGQVTDLGTVIVASNGWQYLFDGKTLNGWRECDFVGRSEVRIANGCLVMKEGNDMTGVKWTKDLPRLDYEVTLQAMRVDGSDFFCGLTFPVKEDPCTLILGGWGGSLVGLSSLDGMDASENETTTIVSFQNQRWYRVRLRVTAAKIEAWLDSQKIIDANITDRKISIRWECEPCKPFGIATWRTTGAVRDIRIRRL